VRPPKQEKQRGKDDLTNLMWLPRSEKKGGAREHEKGDLRQRGGPNVNGK